MGGEPLFRHQPAFDINLRRSVNFDHIAAAKYFNAGAKMNVAAQQDRLGTVSALAALLADRILMERMTAGVMPVAKGEALWVASLALEANEQPVPDIVTDVLAQFRLPEADNDAEPVPDLGTRDGHTPTRMLDRLLRPFRMVGSA